MHSVAVGACEKHTRAVTGALKLQNSSQDLLELLARKVQMIFFLMSTILYIQHNFIATIATSITCVKAHLMFSSLVGELAWRLDSILASKKQT